MRARLLVWQECGSAGYIPTIVHPNLLGSVLVEEVEEVQLKAQYIFGSCPNYEMGLVGEEIARLTHEVSTNTSMTWRHVNPASRRSVSRACCRCAAIQRTLHGRCSSAYGTMQRCDVRCRLTVTSLFAHARYRVRDRYCDCRVKLMSCCVTDFAGAGVMCSRGAAARQQDQHRGLRRVLAAACKLQLHEPHREVLVPREAAGPCLHRAAG